MSKYLKIYTTSDKNLKDYANYDGKEATKKGVLWIDKREKISNLLYSETNDETTKFTDFIVVKNMEKDSIWKLDIVCKEPNVYLWTRYFKKDINLDDLEVKQQTQSSFVMSLQYIFDTEFKVYFIQTYTSGGSLSR